MNNDKSRLNEQDESLKIHGTNDDASKKEKYLRDAGKIEDMPSQDDHADMDVDPGKNEGHTKEWQDRARVVIDAKKDAGTEASPNQSPTTNDDARINENNSNY